MISKSYKCNVLLVIIYISTILIIIWYDDCLLDKEKRPNLYPLTRDIGQKRRESNAKLSEVRREKGIILAWRHPGGNIQEGYSAGTYGNCTLTYNRSLFNDAILVLFDFTAFDEKVGLDGYVRSPDQIFVWNTMESSATLRHTHHRHFKQFDGIMNWTMTYRRDSDILSSYADPNLVRGLLEHHS
uniref:Fucosyltransferase N-terminal domain-containing protein n=1 Tax=Ciona savignyi TaxID=51511 RepID=H2YTU5_CIOSA